LVKRYLKANFNSEYIAPDAKTFHFTELIDKTILNLIKDYQSKTDKEKKNLKLMNLRTAHHFITEGPCITPGIWGLKTALSLNETQLKEANDLLNEIHVV